MDILCSIAGQNVEHSEAGEDLRLNKVKSEDVSSLCVSPWVISAL